MSLSLLGSAFPGGYNIWRSLDVPSTVFKIYFGKLNQKRNIFEPWLKVSDSYEKFRAKLFRCTRQKADFKLNFRMWRHHAVFRPHAHLFRQHIFCCFLNWVISREFETDISRIFQRYFIFSKAVVLDFIQNKRRFWQLIVNNRGLTGNHGFILKVSI